MSNMNSRRSDQHVGTPPLRSPQVERIIEGFIASGKGLPGLRMILAHTRGNSVHFIVVIDTTISGAVHRWDGAINWLEPRLHIMILNNGSNFDYEVVEDEWNKPIPVGYYEVYSVR